MGQGSGSPELDELVRHARKLGEDLRSALAPAAQALGAAVAPVVLEMQPALPYLLQAGASMGAYTLGLATAQAAGLQLRVSCATPLYGPVAGAAGVAFASVLSGQAGRAAAQLAAGWERPQGRRRPRSARDWRAAAQEAWGGVRANDVLLDAALGLAFFKALGGVFRAVMPSDLTQVGALARESLPARGVEYATEVHKRELQRFFRRDGCHHCGSRRGGVIGDHMPPNKLAKELVAARAAAWRWLDSLPLGARGWLQRQPAVRAATAAVGAPIAAPRQRFYPQCVPCSLKQSTALRHERTSLVLHSVLHRGGRSTSWHAAGALVGLRHGRGQPDGGARGNGGRSGSTGSAGRLASVSSSSKAAKTGGGWLRWPAWPGGSS